MHKDKLIEIHDIFFISKIIKNFNKDYRLFYNTEKNLYEIHNIKINPSFIISYKNYPNKLLLDKLVQTNQNNMKKLFEEIEKNNLKIQKNEEEKLIDLSKQQLNSIFSYQTSNPNKVLSPNQIKKIIEKRGE